MIGACWDLGTIVNGKAATWLTLYFYSILKPPIQAQPNKSTGNPSRNPDEIQRQKLKLKQETMPGRVAGHTTTHGGMHDYLIHHLAINKIDTSTNT